MFCPHCHNKIPDGSNFCPLCYANLVGVKQQEKESEAETDAPRPKQKPAPNMDRTIITIISTRIRIRPIAIIIGVLSCARLLCLLPFV